VTTDDRLVVYLAGPVRGPNALWRQDFEAELMSAGGLNALCIHPGANVPGVTTVEEANARTDLYVAGDLLSVRRADIVVAYIRAEESGRGTGFELGYAHALGKTLLLVAESAEDERSWCFAIGSAPAVYPSLAAAAEVVRYLVAQVHGTSSYDPGLPG
jgi:nucleoside 2-deoxyribosyltransferase